MMEWTRYKCDVCGMETDDFAECYRVSLQVVDKSPIIGLKNVCQKCRKALTEAVIEAFDKTSSALKVLGLTLPETK